jgi:hypothetical protein
VTRVAAALGGSFSLADSASNSLEASWSVASGKLRRQTQVGIVSSINSSRTWPSLEELTVLKNRGCPDNRRRSWKTELCNRLPQIDRIKLDAARTASSCESRARHSHRIPASMAPPAMHAYTWPGATRRPGAQGHVHSLTRRRRPGCTGTTVSRGHGPLRRIMARADSKAKLAHETALTGPGRRCMQAVITVHAWRVCLAFCASVAAQREQAACLIVPAVPLFVVLCQRCRYV